MFEYDGTTMRNCLTRLIGETLRANRSLSPDRSPSRRRSFGRLWHPTFRACFLGSLLCLVPTFGCSTKARPIFEEPVEPLVWPAQPAQPRIRFIGQLRESTDLKPAAGFFKRMGDFLVGPKPSQPMYGPRAVVRSRDGERVWIADPGGRCLHLFDLENRKYAKITRIAGAPLLSPVGLCLGEADSFYVCDSEDVAIHRLSSRTGALIETLRIPEDVSRPAGLGYDVDSGELYIADVVAHDIKVLDRDAKLLRIIGQRGSGPGEFNFPSDVVFDRDRIWVADSGNHRVQSLKLDGTPLTSIGQAGDAPGDLALPKGVAVDRDGHVYVVDGRFENVQVFDRQGKLLTVFGEEGTGPGEFWLPSGIYVDFENRIWVCDSYNRRLQVFDYLPELQGSPR